MIGKRKRRIPKLRWDDIVRQDLSKREGMENRERLGRCEVKIKQRNADPM